MRLTFLLLMMFLLLLPASSQLLTQQEIESALGSKTSYSKMEVVTIIQDLLKIVEEEMATAQADVITKHEAEVSLLKLVFADEYGAKVRENTLLKVLSIGEAVIIVGYSIFKVFGVVK